MFFYDKDVNRRHIFFDDTMYSGNCGEDLTCNDLEFATTLFDVPENSLEIGNIKPTNAKSPVNYYINGDDANLVTIENDTLKLLQTLDYERPIDSNNDNILEFTIVAIDADGKGISDNFAINVLNVDDTVNIDNPQNYNETYQIEFTEYHSGYFLAEFNDGGYILNNSQNEIPTSLGTLQVGEYKNTSTATNIGATKYIDMSNPQIFINAKIDDSVKFKFEVDNLGSISKIDTNDPNFKTYDTSGNIVNEDDETIVIVNTSIIATRVDYKEKPKPTYIDMSDNIAEVTLDNLSYDLPIKFEPDSIEFVAKFNQDDVDIYDNDGNKVADNVTTYNSQAIFIAKREFER
jgi:hypothetical protein